MRSARRAGPAIAHLARAVVRQCQAISLTEEEVAHRSSQALRRYHDLQSGQLTPAYLTLKAIAAALSVDLADLTDRYEQTSSTLHQLVEIIAIGAEEDATVDG